MENQEEKKKAGAKEYSKFAMIFATVWVVVMTVLKSVHVIDLSISDIVASAAAVVAMWAPTFVSVWLDKIKQIRFGE